MDFNIISHIAIRASQIGGAKAMVSKGSHLTIGMHNLVRTGQGL